MKKFAHIGSYNRNLGDNVALYNVRKEFNLQYPNIEWVTLDIRSIFWDRNNNVSFVKEFFKTNNFDAIVVGGGGLIEYAGYENQDTGYKLPFNKEIMESIKCPIYFVGLGINYFRGQEGFSETAKQALKDTIEYSTQFSLRNDGSIQILKDLNIYSDKVVEIPDPGLLYDYEKRKDISSTLNIIQPAFNANSNINKNRFNGENNIQKLVEFVNTNKLSAMPHTHKDYRYFSNFILDEPNLRSLLSFEYTSELVKLYLNFNSIIALRGHGQLISIGLNIPGLYFSTQDKVKDFSLNNGFEEYNIDINDNNWYDSLIHKHKNIISNTEYRANWHSIRNAKLEEWNTTFKNYIKQCLQTPLNTVN